MLTHRCPWCGKRLPGYSLHLDLFTKLNDLKNPPSCPNCKNVYTLRTYKNKQHFLKVDLKLILFEVFIVIAYYLWVSRNDSNHTLWGLFLLVSILIVVTVIILFKQTPFERLYNRNDDRVFAFLRKERAAAQIQWAEKNPGLWNPQIQIQDGEIFPAYFKDQSGTLISSALCVVLEEIKWTKKRQCTCEISFVLDDVSSEQYFKKGNHCYLYYYNQQVAEGKLL